MDHDAYEHYVEDRCINKNRLNETVLKISPELIDQVGLSMSNPFKKQLGQLTVYRIRLHFRKLGRTNNGLLPYEKQIWPAYMGLNGDCHANT